MCRKTVDCCWPHRLFTARQEQRSMGGLFCILCVCFMAILVPRASAVTGCNPSKIDMTLSNDLVTGFCTEMPKVTCQGWEPDEKPSYTLIDLALKFAVDNSLETPYLCTLTSFKGMTQTFRGELRMTTSSGKDSGVPVFINIVTMDDPPVIKSFTATLPENTVPGVWRHKVDVSDPDTGAWGDVLLLPLGFPSMIKLRQEGSDYYIVLEGSLDAETDTQYFFEIDAMDGGGKTAAANFTINVIDVNDNKPDCSKAEALKLSLTANLATPVVYMPDICTDADIYERNQILSYKINEIEHCENGRFFMMPDGTIMVNRPPPPNETFCVIHVAVSDRDFTTHVPLKVYLVGCRPDIDERGTFWGVSWPEWTVSKTCPDGYAGQVTRYCSADSVYSDPVYRCTQIAIYTIHEQIQAIQNGTGNATLSESLGQLVHVMNSSEIRLEEGDIRTVEDILTGVINVTSTSDVVQHEEIDVFLDVASNLLDPNNTRTWKALLASEGEGANTLLGIIDNFVETIKPKIHKRDGSVTKSQYAKSNLLVQVGEMSRCTEDIQFPDPSISAESLPPWLQASSDTIKLSCQAAADVQTYSGATYRDISDIVPGRFSHNGEETETAVKSSIVSLQLIPDRQRVLDPPVKMTFTVPKAVTNPVCGFWNTTTSNGSGAWATEGCWRESFHDNTVVCACNHLTNFAILMSPTKAPEEHGFVLSVISITGCGVSMFCLMATLAMYAIFWRTVQSDRSIILINLCTMLLLAYLIFLVGVKQTEIKELCTSIALLLHYLYLVVFFLMLAEGVDLARSVMFVGGKQHVGLQLILPAWLIPAFIVVVTAGVSQLEGYGNDQFCWLTIEGGMLWAFIGPVLLVILVNFVIIVMVLRQMFLTSKMKSKSDMEKAKIGVRSLCVLLPIMGVTWVIGLFAVNENTVVFQYAFTILNSFQGVFIFFFHCVMNRKIREALFQAQKKRRTRALLGGEMQAYARSQDTLATLA